MTVYRLSKRQYINDLSGVGARMYGGRWNSKGLPMIYTSSSRALCTAEVAVHLPLGILPSDYYMASILIPDHIHIEELAMKKLKKEWPLGSSLSATHKIGDKFIMDSHHLVLRVPSAVVQGDFNYLINPLHPHLQKIKIKTTEVFTFDERLFRR